MRTILFSDGARGVYIPQHFAQTVNRASVDGVSDEEFRILESGPDHESYNDVWTDVLNNARITDGDLTRYFLYQDGDLWLVTEEDDEEDDDER